ncbi:hypothetical protein [Novosphingobium sp.]|uniref:tetratricopeptide repeat protein n=1 Tax=Novosphingobium sp. TaxID=1874826 RepID=UPI0025DA09D5|nr:hypothetical protein [Novosphingobium sp.]
MPLPFAVLLPLLAQVGPTGTQIQAPLDMPKRKTVVSAPAITPPSPVAKRLGECLDLAQSDPAAAVTIATGWRAGTKGSARVPAGHCLGLALSAQQSWLPAEAAFLEARADTSVTDQADRARLGAMAANAALAAGNADRALTLLDTAHAEALAAADARLAGEVAIDRARALVALKRDSDASAALAEARTNAPSNATGWLLSATLLRRQGKLGEAQGLIERAAVLAPLDPDVGLEAGVIAVLGLRDEAARRSWQSVIAAAPGSDQARIAKQYLDQLGPDTSPSTR